MVDWRASVQEWCPGGERREVVVDYDKAKWRFDEVYYAGGHSIEEVIRWTVVAALGLETAEGLP